MATASWAIPSAAEPSSWPPNFVREDEYNKIAELRVLAEKNHQLGDADRRFLTDITLARFLRARDGNVQRAYKMLSAALVWRRKRSPERVICHACRNNPRAHSLRPIALDALGRPVLYSHFNVDNKNPDDNIEHLIYLLEHLFDVDAVRAHCYVWVIDFHNFGLSSLHPGFAKQAITLFQNYYPERMGKVVVYDAPRSFQLVYRAVRPFIDENTRRKILFANHNKKASNKLDDAFDDAILGRLHQEFKLTREQPHHRFWDDQPILPMKPLNMHLVPAEQASGG